MTEPVTLTKLIILYMLDSVDHSLPKSQIFGFIIDNDYTNYFTLMQASTELIDAGFITISTKKNSTIFSISDEGRNTINSFADRLSSGIKEDIAEFFKDNKVETKSALMVETNYYLSGLSGYTAELIAKEKNIELIHLKINLPTEEAAASACKSFEDNSEAVYDLLIDALL